MANITIQPLAHEHLSAEFEELMRKGALSDMANVNPACLFALGATEGTTPVGVVTALVQPRYKLAEMQSLGVAKDDAKDVALIGKQLLDQLESELAKQEIRAVAAIYPSHSPLHSLFQSHEWEGPRIVMLSCYFISHLFAPAWHLKSYRLPKGFAYFPWEELTDKDKEAIQALWEKGDLEADIYPFYEPTRFESNSLGLRFEGKLVGWSLAESKAPQSLWYSKLYIDPAWRTSGIAIQLLSASIQRHDHVRFPNVFFRLNLVQSSLRWMRFVKRRLVPYANSVTEYYQMWHKFNNLIA